MRAGKRNLAGLRRRIVRENSQAGLQKKNTNRASGMAKVAENSGGKSKKYLENKNIYRVYFCLTSRERFGKVMRHNPAKKSYFFTRTKEQKCEAAKVLAVAGTSSCCVCFFQRVLRACVLAVHVRFYREFYARSSRCVSRAFLSP